MNLLGLLLTFFVGLFILIGTIFGLKLKDNKKLIDISISVAFGVVFALISLELIPEVLEILLESMGVGKGILIIVVLVILGFLILQQLDVFIPHHEEHNHKHKHSCHDEHLKHIGIITSVALILHNIIEGMSLYIASTNNIQLGLLLCIGIGLHNLPMGLVIASTFLNEYGKKKIIIISLLVSLSTFLGGFILFLFGGIQSEFIMGLLLCVTLGMLMYIEFFELLDQVLKIENKKISAIGIAVGILLLFISTLFE